ncbi:hypothetical protein CSG_13720 [Campylobacter fetus subsp. venerealis str. 84-112]|nr:Hypothetical protein CFV354_1330 [Campylobacter fetus subsp. venerealis NCTC 10354]CDF65283.1 hypothetical protein CSG_13720 [Campylobacter fetus subsp. venerealis str. 84-112]
MKITCLVWVDSWLENYEKGKTLDELLNIIKKYEKPIKGL